MTEVNKANFRVTVPNKTDSPLIVVPLTLQEVVDWINNKSYDEYTKKELIKQAAQYPGNALRNFCKQIPQHIARITKQKRDQQQ